jgi:hypothetical protein
MIFTKAPWSGTLSVQRIVCAEMSDDLHVCIGKTAWSCKTPKLGIFPIRAECERLATKSSLSIKVIVQDKT